MCTTLVTERGLSTVLLWVRAQRNVVTVQMRRYAKLWLARSRSLPSEPTAVSNLAMNGICILIVNHELLAHSQPIQVYRSGAQSAAVPSRLILVWKKVEHVEVCEKNER